MVKAPQDHLPPATEPFVWTSNSGVEITLPNRKVIKSGWLRRHRTLDEADLTYTALEDFADPDQIALTDELDLEEMRELFKAWMGATPGESGRSST